MGKVNLDNNTYEDKFNFKDQFSKILFLPDHMLAQRDLNESQSMIDAQLKLIGNYIFKNGTILSGMNLNAMGSTGQNNNLSNNGNISANSNQKQNLLSSVDISAINSSINTNDWHREGAVDVAPESEDQDDYPGVELQIQHVPHNEDTNPVITVSFGIQQETGTLHNLGFDYPDSANITTYTIDGIPVNSIDGNPVSNNKPVILNDGKVHTVTITFQLQQDSLVDIDIVANNNFNMLNVDNSVRFKLSSLMVNTGSIAAPWHLSDQDAKAPQAGSRNQIINIGNGLIYLDGQVREFDAQDIDISGVGKETIGVQLNEDVVGADKNNNLYDLTKGAPSEWERLADRLHYNVVLTYDDPQSVPIYTLINGKIINGNSSTGNQRLDNLLAERTYDQSGSYRVQGLDFYTAPDRLDSKKLDLIINAGIAYVMGYGIYKLGPTTIPQSISDESGYIEEEPLRFPGDTSDTGAMTSYQLIEEPVEDSSVDVYGPLELKGASYKNAVVHNQDISEPDNLPDDFQHGITGIQLDDNLNGIDCHWGDNGNPYETQVIFNEADGHTIIKRTGQADVEVKDGLQLVPFNGSYCLDWSDLEGDENSQYIPAGDTYYIDAIAPTHHYVSNFQTQNGNKPDYIILPESDSNNLQTKNGRATIGHTNDATMNTKIEFGVPGTTGLRPPVNAAKNGELNADYIYYKATVGIITLDKNGKFNLVKGQPAPLGEARPPEQIDPNTLKLGYITLYPNSYKSNCEFSSVTRIPFSGIQDIATRVSSLETAFQNELLAKRDQQNIDPTTINNTINDDFTTLAAADTTDVDFDVAYDLTHGIISLNDQPGSIRALRPKPDITSHTSSYDKSNRLITAPYQEVAQESQDLTTSSMPIINSARNNPTNGLLVLSPTSDSYVDNNNYTFDLDNNTTNLQLHNWFTYENGFYSKRMPQLNLANRYHFGNSFNNIGYSQWSLMQSTGLKTALSGTEKVAQRTIHFDTKWLKPHSTGYYILLDGKIPVSACATNNNNDAGVSIQGKPVTINGIRYATVSANAYGEAKGYFTVPRDYATESLNQTISPNPVPQNDIGTINVKYVEENAVVSEISVKGQDGDDFYISDYEGKTPEGFDFVDVASGGDITSFNNSIQYVTIDVSRNENRINDAQAEIIYEDIDNNNNIVGTITVNGQASSIIDYNKYTATIPEGYQYYGFGTYDSSIQNGDKDVILVQEISKMKPTVNSSYTDIINMPTGVRKFTLLNQSSSNGDYGEEVSGNYIANGIKNDDEETVTHQYNAYNTNSQTTTLPPLAQTVYVRKDSVLTSVDLYFSQAGHGQYGNQGNILVQLRKVEQGYPSNTVIAQATIVPGDVKVSSNGEAPTHIEFDDPVFVHGDTEVAITITTNSPLYRLYGAALQQPLINDTSTMLTKTTYSGGHLIGSDGIQWIDYPTTNLKFSLNRANFEKSGQVDFKPINIAPYYQNQTITAISKLSLLADYITPNNTSINWALTINTGSNPNKPKEWSTTTYPINRRRDIEKINDQLTQSEDTGFDFNSIESLQLHLYINSENENDSHSEFSNVSPLIDADTIALAMSETPFTDKNQNPNLLKLHFSGDKANPNGQSMSANQAKSQANGCYVSRDLETFDPNFNTITTTFDAYQDNNCKVIPVYSVDGGNNWNYYPKNSGPYQNYPKTIPVSQNFTRYTYKMQLPNSNQNKGELDTYKEFEVAILMFTNSPYHQPMVRRLTNILTLEQGEETDNLPYEGPNSINRNNWNNSRSDPNDWNTYNSNINE